MTNGWKFTMHRFREGERNEVVGVLIPNRKVLVITAYGWEKSKRNIRQASRDVEENDYDGGE
jgi:hypothetical protein